jgi:transposase
MRNIKDVLRLKYVGDLSYERIAIALGVSKGAVTKYAGLATAAGLSWEQIEPMDEAQLHSRLIGSVATQGSFVLPNYGIIHQELRRKGMTLMLLWEEHVEQHGQEQTHRYAQFCVHYREYAKSLKRTMRQIHRGGEKLFIDFAGTTVGLREGDRAHIFVAALGASSYTFACATARETMADWLGATAKALTFFGGVTQLIVPDNPKAMIAHANRYEPRANETVQDFARHYGTSILPARPRRPQDKAVVESSVQVVLRWIVMRLRNQQFDSVDDVNEAIAPLLERLNNKPFQKLPGSRASAFAAIDAPALQALPAQPWEFAVFKTVKVHIDYHVEFEGHRYSVPQALVGQVLELRVTQTALEVLHRGQRVAAHKRNAHKGGFTTVSAHLPAAHRAHLEWSPDRLIHWGQCIGVATGQTVTRLLQERKHPEHGYRACLGLLSLGKQYGHPRLEAACQIALELGTTKYSHVRDILASKRDQMQPANTSDWTSPQHEHVRGPSYYQ